MEGQGAAVQNRSTLKGPKSHSPYYVGPVAPLSVAPQFSSAREEGQKLVATSSGRVPIQPSICGIPSAHMPSLRSPAALDKTREVFIEHQKQLWMERQQRPRQKQNFPQGPRSPNNGSLSGGHPRYSRLLPLGVVDSEVMNPEEVLGVLPVRLQNNGAEDTRPKSSAAPRLTSLSERNAAVVAKVKPRKRSYSAVLSNQLSGEELGEMLYVSRHMALVPEGEQRADNSSLDLQSITKALPAVMGNKAFGKKSIKSLRQGRHTKVKMAEAKKEEFSPGERLPPIGADNSRQIINIKISTSGSSSEDVKVDDSKISPAASPKANGKTVTAENNTPRTLSPKIVSIGEAKEMEKTVLKMKHHPSSGVKRHLSQGWSSPQPIKGLTGSPLHTAKGRREANKDKPKDRIENGEVEAMHRASTPGMMVNINISDFLGTDSEPDNAENEPDHAKQDIPPDQN